MIPIVLFFKNIFVKQSKVARGFFLIEIIIAVTVFAFGSMVIMSTLVQGFLEMQDAMYRLDATTAAINYIEQWRVYDTYNSQNHQQYTIKSSSKKIGRSLRILEITVQPKEQHSCANAQEIHFVAYKNE